jgi:hypothetical protein
MKTIKYASLLLTCAWFAASGTAAGHGAVSMEQDICKLKIGSLQMHFAGYQPDSSRSEFCEDIPQVGRTVIVLDFIDDALRDFRTEVLIIRNSDNASDGKDQIVYRVPPARYPNGSIAVDYDFDRPGDFVGVIRVDEGTQILSGRFPFAVGQNRLPVRLAMAAAVLVALAGGAFRWASRRRARYEYSGALGRNA